MKKSLLIIAVLIISLFNNTAFSQIIVNSTDYRLPVGEDMGSIRGESVSLAVPTFGENVTWDYRTSIGLGTNYSVNFNAYDNNPNFPNASAMYYYTPSLGSIEINDSRQYLTLNESGLFDSGFETEAGVYSLTALTGGPNDNLTMLNSFNYFTNYKLVEFPLTYGKTWTANKRAVTSFTLFLPAFGQNNTPGELVQLENSTREVVGYGTLRVAAMDGVPALLVKNTVTTIDSVYLGGAPAPPSLMNAFQLTQGQTSTNISYKFYVSDSVSAFSAAALSLYTDQSNEAISYFEYCDEEYKGFILSVENDAKSSINLYPNPATNNEINVSFNKVSNNNWSVNLMNISGQIIEKTNVNTIGDVNHRFDLNNLAKGVYLVVVYDENGKHKFSKEFVK